MIEFFPSCALAISPPWGATSKQQIGAEWPKKNRLYSLVSISIAMREPHDVKRIMFSFGNLDHFKLRHRCGE